MRDRFPCILDMLETEGRVSVEELAGRLGVSVITVRRDLSALERQGSVVRTHGGAILATHGQAQRHSTYIASSPERAAIGKAAATLVQPGQTVLIDTGTTALEVARHLPQRADITVATTSLGVAEELYGTPITVVLLGGVLRREFPSVYGPITETILHTLNVDIAFMGCDAANSEEGFYTQDVHLANLEQAMTRKAHCSVVVTESAKFHRRAFIRYATPEDVDIVVTDGSLSREDAEKLQERGVVVRAL